MREIQLTKGFIARVDAEDYERLTRRSWHASDNGHGGVYAKRRDGKRLIPMHREVMGLGADDPREVDHEDGDTLNNQKYNLRPATRGQNAANTDKPKGVYSSKYKGVSRRKQGDWEAYISVNDRKVNLGLYDDEVEAALAYDVAALRYRGPFAKLNFPIAGGAK